jgi:hypothetical protein
MDIYYKEEQMNSFRDSLKRQLEKLRVKIESHFARQGEGIESGLSEQQNSMILVDEKKLELLQSVLQDELLDGKEPLAVSLIHTIHQDLSQMHAKLQVLANYRNSGQLDITAAKDYFKEPKNLKLVHQQHSQYIE